MLSRKISCARMHSQGILDQANAIVREERERMRRLLESQSNSIKPPLTKAPSNATVSLPITPSVDDNDVTKVSFQLFNQSLQQSVNPPPSDPVSAPAEIPVQPSPSSSHRVTRSARDPLNSSLLDCTCSFLGRACWVCGSTARLTGARSTDDRPVDIRRALREIEWRRRVGLPHQESLIDPDSALKFWRRALDIKNSSPHFPSFVHNARIAKQKFPTQKMHSFRDDIAQAGQNLELTHIMRSATEQNLDVDQQNTCWPLWARRDHAKILEALKTYTVVVMWFWERLVKHAVTALNDTLTFFVVGKVLKLIKNFRRPHQGCPRRP
jgi:hypothetical protein